MTQPLPRQVVERLGYIRFLHQEGIAQAGRPHPMSSTAILAFHDAVELFYCLAIEHMNVQADRNTRFEKYWTELAKVVPTLTGEREMARLNQVRNSLKHHGVIASHAQVVAAQADVNAFFSSNTAAVFAVDYDSVTMADVIPQQHVREKVRAAQTAETNGDRHDAMRLLADAFDVLFNPQKFEYVERPSPLTFGRSLQWRRDEPLKVLTWLKDGITGRGYQDVRPLAEQIDATTSFAVQAQAALRIMALGMPYSRFIRFDQLTPVDVGTFHNPTERAFPDGYAPTTEDFQYCQHFVIELALRMAEIDRDLEPPTWIKR